METYQEEQQAIGYIYIKKDEAQRMITLVQTQPVFLEIWKKGGTEEKPTVKWIKRRETEDDRSYWNRARRMATGEDKPLTWRRGGYSDLGFKGAEPDPKNSNNTWHTDCPSRGDQQRLKKCSQRKDSKRSILYGLRELEDKDGLSKQRQE